MNSKLFATHLLMFGSGWMISLGFLLWMIGTRRFIPNMKVAENPTWAYILMVAGVLTIIAVGDLLLH